jgi:hypothetical protein
MIPKFQGLGCQGLEFRGLEPGSLDYISLEFKYYVSDPSVSNLRPGLRGLGLRPSWALTWADEPIGPVKS